MMNWRTIASDLFPHSAIVAFGSQANRSDGNKLTIMKLDDLARTEIIVDCKEKEEDDVLGEKYSGSDDDVDEDSDADDE